MLERPTRANNNPKSLPVLVWWLGLSVFFGLTYLLAPIVDADFFWHLKAGQWLLEHRQLPGQDPFSFLAGAIPDPRQYFILTSYWLSQLLYASFYAMGGLSGIIFLRYLLGFGLLTALWWRRQTMPLNHALIMVLSFLFLFANYTFDRPQTFTFLCFSVQVLLVERLLVRAGGYRHAVALLLLMLVWGNLHGGVIIGQVFLAATLVDLMVSRWRGRVASERFRTLLPLFLLAMAMTLANPNPDRFFVMYQSLLGQAMGGNVQDPNSYISEYQSVFAALSQRYSYVWFLLALVAGGYGFMRRVRLLDNPGVTLFFLALAVVALSDIRYAPLFLIYAMPFMAEAFAGWDRRLFLVFGVAVMSFLLLCKEGQRDLGSLTRKGLVWHYYPETAANFLVKANLRGNFYAPANWGGYLLWKLAPESKVFVDGRTLYPQAYLEHVLFERRESTPQRYRQDLAATQDFNRFVEKYRIDYFVLPKTRGGQLSWMVGVLLEQQAWRLIFDQDNAVIFLRRPNSK